MNTSDINAGVRRGIASGLLAISLLGPVRPGAHATTSRQAGREIEKTPAYELMSALDLLDVAPRKGLSIGSEQRRPDGSRVVRIALDSSPPREAFAARGLDILQLELANSAAVDLRRLDLLYAADRRLIAVFPVFPQEIIEQEPQTLEKWKALAPKYFDLSPYEFDIPRLDDPHGAEKWKAFAAEYERDQAIIAAFLAERFKLVSDVYPYFLKNELPYRLHELDAKTGKWDVHGFSPLVFADHRSSGPLVSDEEPADFLRMFRAPAAGKHFAVIPNFPTVYALANLTPDELEYLRQTYKGFDLGSDSKILVVGPGTGVDAWIASLRTRRPISVIGINPLEIANTEATAKIAGFEVRAIIGDNVAGEDGRPRFPGERFDAVFWNMPGYWPAPTPNQRSPLTHFWDGDVGGSVLKRLAKALPGILERDGRVLLWNLASYANGRNEVSEILGLAGTQTAVFDVQDQRFVKRSREPKEWYKGHLYILSRARAP